jgi:hypothetical protein
MIVRGVAAQAATDRAWTLATLLSAPIGRSSKVADEVLAMFMHGDSLSFGSLGESTVLALVDRLERCPTIENHWIQEFLAEASRVAPSRVLQLLIKRIERDEKLVSRDFQPMPYLWDEKPRLKFRQGNDLPVHLRTIREWLLVAPRNTATMFWGPKLYRSVAIDYDQVVLDDLSAWTMSGDAEQLDVIARLLSEAPRGFVFDQRAFVVELLEHAATVNKASLDGMRAALWQSAISGMRHGVPGQPFREDEVRRDRAVEALQLTSRRSAAWLFFDRLKHGAERDIKHKEEREEEYFDE